MLLMRDLVKMIATKNILKSLTRTRPNKSKNSSAFMLRVQYFPLYGARIANRNYSVPLFRRLLDMSISEVSANIRRLPGGSNLTKLSFSTESETILFAARVIRRCPLIRCAPSLSLDWCMSRHVP